MISVAEAQSRILSALNPLPAETISLHDAFGRILAEPVIARVSQPPGPCSAMDGYAVRAQDLSCALPRALRCIGEIPAGSGFRGSMASGETVRIYTGASLPSGANAVVMQEDVTIDSRGATVFHKTISPGHNVRQTGADFQTGQIGIPVGKQITARDIGLAAAMNTPWVRVRRRPRIALLSTGNEIVQIGDPLGPHQIIGSNAPILAALVTACGGVPINLGVAPDQPNALAAFAAGAEGADLLVTSGGASVGRHDLVRDVLQRQGVALDFWKVAMRPGKPLLFGRFGAVPALGLPGNPVSAFVCALLFLRPAIQQLLGQSTEELHLMSARLRIDIPSNDERQTYLRATLSRSTEGEMTVTPFTQQDSAALALLATADCLVIRPPHAPAAAAGESVPILPFENLNLRI
ncbi:Molybdopterin molybdenumtransferase [Azospirillaceae bacterium]